MSETEELKKIKKEYGERFMHMCRELFPTILEEEGKLYRFLHLKFAENCRKSLYDDLINHKMKNEFKEYIYNKIGVNTEETGKPEDKTPYELLNEAGYDLFECKTEEEIQSFKKYYAKSEELCTFKGGRLDRCVVFFAVRKDVDKIMRDDFKFPQREDKYGTSILGIQFNKEGLCTVSIKNRYNHRVNNPDATYGNDLDRITPGLSKSFEKLLNARGLELSTKNIQSFDMPGYTVANDGKYYKYNMEIYQIYYCPGNTIIYHGQPKKLENPETQLLIDEFIVDIKNKNVSLYDTDIPKEAFIDDLQDLDKVEIRKNTDKGYEERTIILHQKGREDPVIIGIDKDNQIVKYINKNITDIGDNFLFKNQKLLSIELPNVTNIGDYFLYNNNNILNLELPKLVKCGRYFMYGNNSLMKIDLPKLEYAENYFLYCNNSLTSLTMPNVTEVKNYFLGGNERNLSFLRMPKLERVGNDFLVYNTTLKHAELPSLTEVGDSFLCHNEILNELELPKLKQIRNNFLSSNILLSDKILSEIFDEKKDKFDKDDIAILDKKSKLTTAEIKSGKRLIEKDNKYEKEN